MMDYDTQLADSQSPSPMNDDPNTAATGGCSFLFVQTQSILSACNTGFRDCQEPAVWCWPRSCSSSSPELATCSINSTAHYCFCSSLPPTIVEGEEEILSSSTNIPTPPPSTSISPTPAYSFLESAQNSSWITRSTVAPPPPSTTHHEPPMSSSSIWSTSNRASTSFSSSSAAAAENDGLPGGAIAAIVVVSVLLAVALIALIFWSMMKLKRKRKLEGRYCPAIEEQKTAANTLPPLPLPAPEGLI